MTSEKTRSRRRYNAEMKARVVAECGSDGTSVAKVAMAHGINANVVHRWRQHARDGSNLATAKTAVSTTFARFCTCHRSTRTRGSIRPRPGR